MRTPASPSCARILRVEFGFIAARSPSCLKPVSSTYFTCYSAMTFPAYWKIPFPLLSENSPSPCFVEYTTVRLPPPWPVRPSDHPAAQPRDLHEEHGAMGEVVSRRRGAAVGRQGASNERRWLCSTNRVLSTGSVCTYTIIGAGSGPLSREDHPLAMTCTRSKSYEAKSVTLDRGEDRD